MTGRVVLLTGGAGGIAAGLAKGFAAAGARLVLTDRTDAAEARAEEIRTAVADVSTQVFGVMLGAHLALRWQ